MAKSSNSPRCSLKLAGIAAFCSPFAFPAISGAGGPPIAFDGFSVSDGTISALCPTGAVCANELIDNGMLQREVSIGGDTFIQFIITEPGVSGDAGANPFTEDRGSLNFSNEDFVMMNNRGDGISSRQTIIESDFDEGTLLENRFVNILEYEFGWAAGTEHPWVDMTQEIAQLDYSDDANNPRETFSSLAVIESDALGFNNHIDVFLAQRVDMTDEDQDAAQGFRYEKKAGVYQPTASDANGNITVSGFPIHTGPQLDGGSNGGSIAWNANNMIAALWIGQEIDGLSVFGHTAFQNHDAGTETRLTSLLDPQPASWVPPFSQPPPSSSLVPVTVAPTAVVNPPVPLGATIAAGTVPLPESTELVDLPIDYDEWTVENGVVTAAPCPSGAICGEVLFNSGGLFQRMVVVDGEEYIHTIVNDTNATGSPTTADFEPGSLAFKSETFIKPNSDGLAANMRIAERDLAYTTQPTGSGLPTAGGEFVYNVQQRAGWANGGPLDPAFEVVQSLYVPETSGLHRSSFHEKFEMRQGENSADRVMNIHSAVGTQDGGFNNPILFYTSMVQGAFQTTTNDPSTDPVLLPGTGESIAWDEGDAIRAVWVGGDYITSDPAGRSIVGTTSYYNLSTGEHISATSIENPDPESWVDPFEPFGLEYSTTYVP